MLQMQVNSHDFEPTFIILFLIGRVLPDQQQKKQIIKHISLLYFWSERLLFTGRKKRRKKKVPSDFQGDYISPVTCELDSK